MRITEEQLAVLDSLRCERFSSNIQNLYDIESFYNRRNDRLVEPLRNEAYCDDEEGRIAYYLVKHSSGKILFYFSLKCGLLYDRFINNDEKMKSLKKLLTCFIELKNDPETSDEDRETINSIFEKIRTQKGFTKADVAKIKKKKEKAIEEIEKEFTDEVKKVGETYAGIEIVQFCANDDDECRKLWSEYGFDQKLGVIVFWHFIVPIILDTMKLIGCQYLFLFAADLSEDEELINYYRNYLKFEDSLGRGTAIPLYDDMCKFMYQETNGLQDKREDFYDHFNHEDDAV